MFGVFKRAVQNTKSVYSVGGTDLKKCDVDNKDYLNTSMSYAFGQPNALTVQVLSTKEHEFAMTRVLHVINSLTIPEGSKVVHDFIGVMKDIHNGFVPRVSQQGYQKFRNMSSSSSASDTARKLILNATPLYASILHDIHALALREKP